jgi:hypothetical protein
MQIIETGYATDQTSSHAQKKFCATPTRIKVVAKVMLMDMRPTMMIAKMRLGH